MGKPAARIGDMHVCPMVTPGTPPVPHVGGPVVGPGCPTVLIGGMPAAVMGDMCTCVGPPDSIMLGSIGVMIGGKPAARMGDMCAHGGMIAAGCPTVLIGELSPAVITPGATAITPKVLDIMLQTTAHAPGKVKSLVQQTVSMISAASLATPFVHNSMNCSVCAGENE